MRSIMTRRRKLGPAPPGFPDAMWAEIKADREDRMEEFDALPESLKAVARERGTVAPPPPATGILAREEDVRELYGDETPTRQSRARRT